MTKEFFQHSAYIEAKDEFCHKNPCKRKLSKQNKYA